METWSAMEATPCARVARVSGRMESRQGFEGMPGGEGSSIGDLHKVVLRMVCIRTLRNSASERICVFDN